VEQESEELNLSPRFRSLLEKESAKASGVETASKQQTKDLTEHVSNPDSSCAILIVETSPCSRHPRLGKKLGLNIIPAEQHVIEMWCAVR
jgi:hypothetical protein